MVVIVDGNGNDNVNDCGGKGDKKILKTLSSRCNVKYREKLFMVNLSYVYIGCVKKSTLKLVCKVRFALTYVL